VRRAAALLTAGLLASAAGPSAAAEPAPARPFAFAPYVYTVGGADLAGWASASGGRYVTLAFYNSDHGACRGVWPMDEDKLLAEVARLRALGGDVIVSSGGWNADDLAARCTTPEALAEVYDGVLTRFAASHLDLDPEPGDIHDNLKPEVVDRRSAALAILQKRFTARGRPLKLSFTIAAQPAEGFDAVNLAVLQSAIAHGVEIDTVNPMIMNYGDVDGVAPGEMDRRSIAALEHAHAQLAALYPDRSTGELWAMMSATPMLGRNDVEAEVFTLEHARLIADFARARGFRRLSFWSTARDNGGCPGAAKPQPGCSGLVQQPWEFSRIFADAMAAR
jgi:hypothetical protein